MTYKLTIDVNLMEQAATIPGMDTLKHWHDEGKIELIEANPPRTAKPAAYGWPGSPPKPPEEKKPSWGGPKARTGKMAESGKANFKSVAAVLFPGKDPQKLNMTEINGAAHLIKHHMSKNDFFITMNVKDFVEGGRRDVIKAYFGITVMTPEETVKLLASREGWANGTTKTKVTPAPK